MKPVHAGELRRQGLSLFTGVVISIGLVVVVQLWLLSIAMDALASGDVAVTAASAVASLGLFALNGGFLLYVRRFERHLRRLGVG